MHMYMYLPIHVYIVVIINFIIVCKYHKSVFVMSSGVMRIAMIVIVHTVVI